MKGLTSILAACFFAFGGLLVAGWLGMQHADLAAVERTCGGGNSCIQVLTSRYATVGTIPTAWIGFGYYAVCLLLLLTSLAVPAGGVRRSFTVLTLAGATTAAIGAAALMVIQFLVIRGFCPFCTLSALCMLLIAVFLWIGRRDRDWPAQPLLAVIVVIAFGGAATLLRHAMISPPLLADPVLARLDGRPLTLRQMQREGPPELAELQMRLYEMQMRWVEAKIADTLIEQEAKRRGMGVDDLIRAEVNDNTKAQEAALDEWIEKQRQTAGPDFNGFAVKSKAEDELRLRRRREWVRALAEKHNIELLLKRPEGRALKYDPALAHRQGPADATIRFVFFSDFECPYCAELAGILQRLCEKYSFEVSLEYLHLPLAEHPKAQAAAEAAEAAAEQGKFWLYHDELMKQKGRIDGDWIGAARRVGLDLARFRAALGSPAAKDRIDRSRRDGLALGLTGVPALFMNGRYIGGLLSFDELDQLVRLERRKLPYVPPGRK